MADIENKYYLPIDGDSQPVTSRRWLKLGVTLFSGLCVATIALFYITAEPANGPMAAQSANLLGLSTRSTNLRSFVGNPSIVPPTMCHLKTPIPDSGLEAQRIAMKSMGALCEGKRPRDVLTRAEQGKITEWAGITAPLGFWDPYGFATDLPEGRLLYYREAEIKHGRVAMLATLGMVVAEKWHPLWGGDIDVPSAAVFQEASLGGFWAVAAAFFGILESANPEVSGIKKWGIDGEMDPSHTPGDLGFDPLGIKPKKEAEFKSMQNREINNGRLAMFASLGIIGQELVTNQKILPGILN